MAENDKNLIWWIVIVFVIITIIGIIIFVLVDQFDRSTQQTQLQETVGGTCQTDNNCLPGLSCLNSVCTTPASSTGNLGDNCQSDSDCLSSLTCQNSICKAKIGTACTMLDDCVMGATACTKTTKLCSNQPLPGTGGSCINLPCQSGLTCQNNICRAPHGGSCLDDNGCLEESSGCSNGICISQGGLLNDICRLPDLPCSENLVCDLSRRDTLSSVQGGSICKLADGMNCGQDGDCKTGSSCRTDRYGNIHSKVCLPETSLFDYCNSHQECGSGLCGDSKLMSDIDGQLRPVHRFPNTLIDVIQEGDNILMLLGDGNIMREVHSPDGSEKLEMIKNSRRIEKFAVLGSYLSGRRILSGLSQGRLYQLDLDASTKNSWKWKLASWAPSGITHISHSHDGNYLWIQFHIKFHPENNQLTTISSDNLTQYGRLYRFIEMRKSPVLVKQSLLSGGIIRTYGRNDVCYLDINQITHQATRYPKGDLIRDCHLGMLMPDGSVYKVGSQNRVEVRDVRLIRGVPHLITHRQCVPMADFSSYSAPAIPPVSNHSSLFSSRVRY